MERRKEMFRVTQHYIGKKKLIPVFFRLEGREMFYLRTHSTHHIYGYIASGIW